MSSPQKGGRIGRAIRYVRTEPGLLRNVVAITVVVILGLGIGGLVLSQQRFDPPWQSRGHVWATFKDAASVAPGLGQSVLINGVEVGKIQDTQVDNQGNGLVMMTIEKKTYDRPIYRNATVVMRPTTPLNTMYIELNPGTPDSGEVPEYGVLPVGNSVSPVEIDQPLAHLDENTREAVRAILSQADVALAQAPRDLPGGVEAVAQTTKSLQPIVAQLDQRRDKIKQLITSLGQISQAIGGNDIRLTNLANSLQVTLRSVASQSDALRNSFNQLPGVTRSLKESTGAVQGLADQLDPTLNDIRDASDTLPDSLSSLRDTINTADTTVSKLGPVANKLRPTAADLRPFVNDLNATFPDLKSITFQANTITDILVPYLPDVTAFTYQTRSVVSTGDGNGRNNLRALVVEGPSAVPGVPSTPLTAPLAAPGAAAKTTGK